MAWNHVGCSIGKTLELYPGLTPWMSSRRIAFFENDRLDAGDLSTDGQSAINVPDAINPRHLETGSPPFDIAIIKDFLRFIALISEGRIDEELERTTADSLNVFAKWSFARFAQVTGKPIPKEGRSKVYNMSAPKVKQHDPCLALMVLVGMEHIEPRGLDCEPKKAKVSVWGERIY